MDIALLIIEALKFIFPAYCANGTPVLAGGGTKMDLGKNFIDGKRIFGNNKTFRGFFFGWAIGMLVGSIEYVVFPGFPILFIVLTPLGALLGDLTGAFLKRRIGIAPGGLLPIVDQIDFVIGALCVCSSTYDCVLAISSYRFVDNPANSSIYKFLSLQNEVKKTPLVTKILGK